MRPLCGMVLRRKGSSLVIRLETGFEAKIPKIDGLEVGTQCWALFDFTKNKIRKITTTKPVEADDKLQEIIEEDTPDTDDHWHKLDYEEHLSTSGSGALSTGF